MVQTIAPPPSARWRRRRPDVYASTPDILTGAVIVAAVMITVAILLATLFDH